ncbi:MAG: hypothetical protein J6B41_07065 [Alistipes sp.]|nr:hypothetical protein [Alistipes sp.]
MTQDEFINAVLNLRKASQQWEDLSLQTKSDTPPSKTELRHAYFALSKAEETVDTWLPRFAKGICCDNCRYGCTSNAGLCRHFEPKEE